MSDSESLRGQFLIAGNNLRDSNFYKTVVLMLEQNDSGSMGLVINRPMDVTVSSALSKHFEIPECEHFLYCGGPVEPNALLIPVSYPHFRAHVTVLDLVCLILLKI